MALALGAAGGTPATGAAQTVPFSYNDVIPNPCAPDLVAVWATGHVETSSTTDGSGALHVHVHRSTAHLVGVGVPSGSIYHGEVSDALNIELGPPPDTRHFRDMVVLSSQGNVKNLLASYMIQVTVNAKGVVTATVIQPVFRCTG
jgi:hypothetical protein